MMDTESNIILALFWYWKGEGGGMNYVTLSKADRELSLL